MLVVLLTALLTAVVAETAFRSAADALESSDAADRIRLRAALRSLWSCLTPDDLRRVGCGRVDELVGAKAPACEIEPLEIGHADDHVTDQNTPLVLLVTSSPVVAHATVGSWRDGELDHPPIR